jgi:hypothetical protein
MACPKLVNVRGGKRPMMKQSQESEQVTKCISTLDFTKDWTTWRDTLKEAIMAAKGIGLSDESIQNIAVTVGDFMAEKVCTSTPEEALIKDMWSVASPDERKVLATLIFRILK